MRFTILAGGAATLLWRYRAKPMGNSKRYLQFRIDIRPSPESNDHEVRFFGDGDDIIARYWNDMMGLDPDDVLVNPSPLAAKTTPHKATVARCNCGLLGCGSIQVTVGRSADDIMWSWGAAESSQVLSFLGTSYEEELRRAQTDTSWETQDRTAARLLANQVDRQALASHGLTFTCASGRVRKGAFSVALLLEPGPYQVLIHRRWSGESAEEIARQCDELLRQPPSRWMGADWFPQQPNLGPPALAGQSWRQGGS